MKFRLARHPKRLNAKHPRLIEDLLEIAEKGQQGALNTLINMLEDLYGNDLQSRFVKKLKGLPIWELKSRSRGRQKGGARIYFFVIEDEAVLVNAEVKADDTASKHKLEEVAEIILAYKQGKPSF